MSVNIVGPVFIRIQVYTEAVASCTRSTYLNPWMASAISSSSSGAMSGETIACSNRTVDAVKSPYGTSQYAVGY